MRKVKSEGGREEKRKRGKEEKDFFSRIMEF